MVGQTQDGFEPCQPVVSVALYQAPEPVGHVERKGTLHQIGVSLQEVTVRRVREHLRLRIFDDRRERTPPAMVGSNQMEHQLPVVSGTENIAVRLDHGDARHLVPHPLRVSPNPASTRQ